MPRTTKTPTTRKKAQHVPLLKITVQIWQRAAQRLEETLRDACFRRDAYLAKVIENELAWLDHEVSIPNSPEANRYVTQELAKLPRKAVTMRLPQALVERLAEICERKRIVRDAFFNRLFLLLVADAKTVDQLLFLGDDCQDWRRDLWSNHKNDTDAFLENGLFPLRAAHDPLWAIRMGLEIWNDEFGGYEKWIDPIGGREILVNRTLGGAPTPIASIYATPFSITFNNHPGSSLLGMSCHLPDRLVPDSEAAKMENAATDELLA
ncbi:hypothetical protein, partial [Ideonella sp.]|uniref:hypothetical protein n=1 Tax=Ideonella sp. TaxID=1929293 RepID=UPI003BB53865